MDDSGKVRVELSQQELKNMMERLEKSNDDQAKYARKQYRMTQITTLASVIVMAIVIYTVMLIVPKVNETYLQLQTIMTDLEIVTSELAEANVGDMVGGVERLVVSSEKGVEEALAKINGIDFDSLNAAIKNLSDVVEPLARFFGNFR